MSVPIIKLNDGNTIPQFGITISSQEKAEEIVKDALNAGIRHIHTSHDNKNEESIGKAVK